MGKPKQAQAAQINTNYNWGAFGNADAGGVNLSPTAISNIATTQGGIAQYLDELINPSYTSESFRARQSLIDENNRQYANQLGAQAIARGARGSATQNILNSIMANRNMDLRNAMTQEDARVRSILSSLAGTESNYFNQANTMARNILSRQQGNQGAQNAVNISNANAYNEWRDNLLSAASLLGGAGIGGLYNWAIKPDSSLFGYNLWGGNSNATGAKAEP